MGDERRKGLKTGLDGKSAATKPSKLSRRAQIGLLGGLLVVIILGGVLFIGAVSGWFGGGKVALEPEYYAATSTLENQDGDFLELLTPERYAELVGAGKSFLLFVDQSACVNAERMRGFIVDYAAATGVKPYRMMFADLRDTALHDAVKYYPSVVVVAHGTPVKWLRADSDEDAAAYNDAAAFNAWLDAALK